MRRPLPFLLLAVALGGSLASSDSEEPGTPPPPGATSTASTSGSLTLGPGQATQRVVEVGVELADMPQITDSWIDLVVEGQSNASTASVRTRLQGFDQSNQTVLNTSSGAVTSRAISVNGVDTGCLGQGDLCWSTWTITFEHTGGSGTASVDWAFTANIDGVNTPIYLD